MAYQGHAESASRWIIYFDLVAVTDSERFPIRAIGDTLRGDIVTRFRSYPAAGEIPCHLRHPKKSLFRHPRSWRDIFHLDCTLSITPASRDP